MPISDSNTTDNYDNTVAVINGGTDNTSIGNVGDRLKVDALLTFPPAQFPSVDYHLKIDDMNVANGGIARGTALTTSFQTLYKYTGSGHVFGFSINNSNEEGCYIRLIIDGIDIFSSTGISTTDIAGSSGYDMHDVDVDLHICAIFTWNNSTSFNFTTPITYSSSIEIQEREISTNVVFRAGVIKLTKY